MAIVLVDIIYVLSLLDPSSHAAQVKYVPPGAWSYEMPRGMIIIFNWKKDCCTAINIQNKASAAWGPSGNDMTLQ